MAVDYLLAAIDPAGKNGNKVQRDGVPPKKVWKVVTKSTARTRIAPDGSR